MYPYSFKEEFGSGLRCDTLLVGHQNDYLRESVDDHENIVVIMLGRRKSRHVIHADGFVESARSRQRRIHALLLDHRFDNDVGSARFDVLPNISLKV